MAPALAVCGGLFGATLFTCAMTMQRPHKSYRPAGYDPEAAAQNATTANLPAGNVHVSEVMKTPQYISLGAVFFCLASGGMGLFTVAKPMVTEVFASSMPNLVTAAFAGMYVCVCTRARVCVCVCGCVAVAGNVCMCGYLYLTTLVVLSVGRRYVNALSVGNLGGRLGWGALSDKIGRRNTFWLFTLGSIPLYLAMPYLVEEVTTTGAALPLCVSAVCCLLSAGACGSTPLQRPGSRIVGVCVQVWLHRHHRCGRVVHGRHVRHLACV